MLKLATFPNPNNSSDLIVRLCWEHRLEGWFSHAMFDEYASVLAGESELLALVQEHFQLCFPLTEINWIKHEPDNRFLECALAVDSDYLITVNTARGHFDQTNYGRARVLTPDAFVNLPEVQKLLKHIA